VSHLLLLPPLTAPPSNPPPARRTPIAGLVPTVIMFPRLSYLSIKPSKPKPPFPHPPSAQTARSVPRPTPPPGRQHRHPRPRRTIQYVAPARWGRGARARMPVWGVASLSLSSGMAGAARALFCAVRCSVGCAVLWGAWLCAGRRRDRHLRPGIRGPDPAPRRGIVWFRCVRGGVWAWWFLRLHGQVSRWPFALLRWSGLWSVWKRTCVLLFCIAVFGRSVCCA
jgi:hypothetical protein